MINSVSSPSHRAQQYNVSLLRAVSSLTPWFFSTLVRRPQMALCAGHRLYEDHTPQWVPSPTSTVPPMQAPFKLFPAVSSQCLLLSSPALAKVSSSDLN